MTSLATPAAGAGEAGEPGTDGTGIMAVAARHPVGVVGFGVGLFSTGPVIIAAASVGGITFSFWRMWIAIPILFVSTLVHRHTSGITTARNGWKWALGCGALFACHQVMFITALQATSVVDVTLMNTIAPIVVGVLAVKAFGERPGPQFRLWAAFAMIGAAAVALVGSTGPEGDPVGVALAAGNVFFYSLFFVGSKLARPHIEPVPFLLGSGTMAAVVVTVFALVTRTDVMDITVHDLLLCLTIALLPGFLGHLSVTWALRWVPANLPPVMMLSIPVLSGAMAWVLLGEAVSVAQAVAGLITLIGVAGAVRSPSAQRLAAESLLLAEES